MTHFVPGLWVHSTAILPPKCFGYICPIAKGWLRESTTVHVFRYHAQDLFVKNGALTDSEGGGGEFATRHLPTPNPLL